MSKGEIDMGNDTAPPTTVSSTDGLGALVERLRCLAGGQDDPHSVALAEAADMLERLEPMGMALCERHSLVLRVGQPYIFEPVGDCESCAAALAQAREAYGPNAGAPNGQGKRPSRLAGEGRA